MPPPFEARSSLVRRLEGSEISKAPNRLSAKTRNTSATNPFTQTFEPSCTTPNGPRMAVAARPSSENSTTIPSENSAASPTLFPREAAGLFRKYETVIGIIGKTQGVNSAARPIPNATSMKTARPCEDGVAGCAGTGGAGADGSKRV